MALDFVCTATAQSVLSVNNKAVGSLVGYSHAADASTTQVFLPSNQILRLHAQCNIIREVQALPPVDNLAVCIVTVLGTEWRPAHQALEHDRSQAPPIAVKAIAVTSENLRGNVVRRSDGGVRHQSSAPSPVVDLSTVRHGQVDLVKGNRVAVAWSVRLALQELLIVVVIVELVEAS